MNEHVITDKWLLASGWQKSVRRGETERAAHMAVALWRVDKHKLLQRLAVVCCEDVGIGNLDAVMQVLNTVGQRPNMQTVLHLSAQLCAGAKNRLVDAVYITAERSAAYYALRGMMADANDNTLTDYVLDESNPLVERCLAVWCLAGTKRYPSDVIPPRTGSLDKAVAAITMLNAPAPLTQACINGLKLMRWPLPLFLPLIHQEAQKHPVSIRNNPVPVSPNISGLPPYSADMFTRVGKSCIRQLQKAVPDLKGYTTQQLGLALFYIEGHCVDKELTSPQLEAIQRAGEMADLATAELHEPEYMRLREILTQHMGVLTDIRRQHLSDVGGQK